MSSVVPYEESNIFFTFQRVSERLRMALRRMLRMLRMMRMMSKSKSRLFPTYMS